MPPRLSPRLIQPLASQATPINISSFLVPFLQTQIRHASILNQLSDNPAAYKNKKRVGRGPSSGKGKTAGRGQKGQKARGKVPAHFVGGQTREEITHGKYGFKNVHASDFSPINLDTIQNWISAGRLNPSAPITLLELVRSNAIHGVKADGVKLLARGATALTTPVNIIVSRASASAIAAVEALGGTVTTRYYTKASIYKIKKGEMHPYISMRWDQSALSIPALAVPGAESLEQRAEGLGFAYRLPDPAGRQELEYYRDAKNRGYLAHMVKEGELASLYYKIPKTQKEIEEIRRRSGKGQQEQKRKELNRLW